MFRYKSLKGTLYKLKKILWISLAVLIVGLNLYLMISNIRAGIYNRQEAFYDKAREKYYGDWYDEGYYDGYHTAMRDYGITE